MKKLIFIYLFFLISCSKEKNPPSGSGNKVELKTAAITNIRAGSATTGGEIIKDGGELITRRGVCWSINANPTIDNNQNVSNSGQGMGSFVSNLTNLLPITRYYVRSFAVNIHGTRYGNELNFLSAAIPPTLSVTCPTANQITQTSANLSLSITRLGGNALQAAGFIRSTNTSFTVRTYHPVTTVQGQLSYSTLISGLTSSTRYYIRSYALNVDTKDTGWSSTCSFLTTSIFPPTLLMNCQSFASGISKTSATLTASVTSNGGANLDITGFEISTNTSFTGSQYFFTPGTPIVGSPFSVLITNLTPGTTYYARAIASNASGMGNSSTCTFKTLDPSPPTVTTQCPPSLSTTSALFQGSFTNPDAVSITERGFYYSTTTNTPGPGSLFIVLAGNATPFSSQQQSLNSCTVYYYRAYVKTSGSTNPILGNVCTFTSGFNPATLTSPANNSTLARSNTLTYRWSGLSCTGVTYRIEISNSSNFPSMTPRLMQSNCTTTPVANALNYFESSTISFCINAVNHTGRWYWRVWTIRGGQREVSPVFTYFIQ